MEKYGKRMIIIIVTTIALLLVFFSGQLLYQKYYVNTPLFKSFGEIKAVTNIKIDDKGSVDKIIVQLKPEANLKKAYGQLDEEIKLHYGNKPYQITFQDHRNAKLENLLTEVEPMLYQGIATGEFVDMVEGVKQEASKQGVKANVYMDNHKIYLVLMQGKFYLQEIIDRGNETPPAGGENL